MAEKKDKPRDDSLVYGPPRNEVEVLPGVRRYQFISKSQHRMLTGKLNRIAMVIIALALSFVIFKAIFLGTGYSVYCLEDRSCLRVLSQPTGQNCPENIFPVEMVVSSRTADYERFIRQGGLRCTQCGNCTKWCILEINIPEIAARMQELCLEALAEGKIDPRLINDFGFVDPHTREPLPDQVARVRYSQPGYEKVLQLYDQMRRLLAAQEGVDLPGAETALPVVRHPRALVSRLLPSRPWRIAFASLAVAVFFPPARLPILLMLVLAFLFSGPGFRWAKRSRIGLATLLLLVPAIWMGIGYLLEEGQRIDFGALQTGEGYVGQAFGKNPIEPVEVTASIAADGAITLAVTAQSESKGRPAVAQALAEVPARIAAARSLEVDGVSGATITSNAVKDAARGALAAAGGAGEQPFYIRAVQWLTYGEFTREMLFQLAIIYAIIFLLDFMLSGVIVRNTGESLNCYNCQACVGTCPVGRVEDDVPLPMTMVLETRLGNYARVEELAKYCVGCGRCAARCPNGISAVSLAGKAIAAKRSIFEL